MHEGFGSCSWSDSAALLIMYVCLCVTTMLARIIRHIFLLIVSNLTWQDWLIWSLQNKFITWLMVLLTPTSLTTISCWNRRRIQQCFIVYDLGKENKDLKSQFWIKFARKKLPWHSSTRLSAAIGSATIFQLWGFNKNPLDKGFHDIHNYIHLLSVNRILS